MSGVSKVNDRVPVAPLREAFEASGLSANAVCIRLGWTRTARQGRKVGYVWGDVMRLKRTLGIAPQRNASRGAYTSYATRIGYEHALRIAEAIGLDPVDVGL